MNQIPMDTPIFPRSVDSPPERSARRPVMSRWRAALIHLSISATIGAVVGSLLFWVWYPPPFFAAGGADELVILLLGVDLTLGPLLTLIVFRPGKRGLKFDLTMIGLAQSIALVYGMSVVLASRPIFLVGAVDRFELVAAGEIDDKDLAEGREPRFRRRSWTGPKLVLAELPADAGAQSDLALSAMSGGKDIQYLPKFYRDYEQTGTQLLSHAHDIDALFRAGPLMKNSVQSWLAENRRAQEDVVWLPVAARKSNLTMLMERRTAKILAILPMEPPW